MKLFYMIIFWGNGVYAFVDSAYKGVMPHFKDRTVLDSFSYI